MQKVSVQGIAQDWIDDSGLDDIQVNEDLLIRWITFIVGKVDLVEEWSHYITTFSFDNYKVELPDNFKKAQAVVFRPVIKKDNCTRQEVVSQWLQTTWDTDYELEINLICKKCNEHQCKCNGPVFEVDVDRTWLMANPQHTKRGWSRFGQIGRGNGVQNNQPYEGWSLLRPATGKAFMSKYLLTDCANINVDKNVNNFRIDDGILEIDHPEGDVIVSYLGVKLDENGDIMIPYDEHLFAAISAHLDYQYFKMLYKKNILSREKDKNSLRSFYMEAMQLRDIELGRYRSRKVNNIDYNEFSNFIDKVWLQRIPDRRWNQSLQEGRRKGLFERYSDVLEGKTGNYYNKY